MSITRKHQNSTFSLFYCTYISMPLIIFFNTYIHVCHWLGCHMILILWQVKSSSSLLLLLLIQHLTAGKQSENNMKRKIFPSTLLTSSDKLAQRSSHPFYLSPWYFFPPFSQWTSLDKRREESRQKKNQRRGRWGRPYLIFSEALNFSRCFKKMKMLFQLKILKM